MIINWLLQLQVKDSVRTKVPGYLSSLVGERFFMSVEVITKLMIYYIIS